MAIAKWIHRLFLVATNLVPLGGVLWFGWSASTLLLVFWGETLFTGTANVVRIAVHRKLTRKRGHFRKQLNETKRTSFALEASRASKGAVATPPREEEEKGSFLAEYAGTLYVFTLAHGLFLAVFVVFLNRDWHGEGLSPWRIDSTSLRNGLLAVLGLTLFELVYDLLTIGEQPFSWLKERVQVALGRVVILHLVILFGAFLLMRFETPMSFLGILVVLKTLLDLGSSSGPVPTPDKPPRWLKAFGEKTGLDMEREWANVLAEQKRRAEEDELPYIEGERQSRSTSTG